MTPKERKAMRLDINNMSIEVTERYQKTGTPKEMVTCIVYGIGYYEARRAIATAINRYSANDNGISEEVRAWANSVEGAYTHEQCKEVEMYTLDSWIYSTYMNQIGEIMMAYKKPGNETEESTTPDQAKSCANCKHFFECARRSSLNIDCEPCERYELGNNEDVYINEDETQRIEDVIEEFSGCSVYADEIIEQDENAPLEDVFGEIGNEHVPYIPDELERFMYEDIGRVEDAINKFGWDGVGGSIYGAIETAFIEKVFNELWENRDEICKLYAFNYYAEKYGKTITKNVREEIERNIDDVLVCEKLKDVEAVVDEIVNEFDK